MDLACAITKVLPAKALMRAQVEIQNQQRVEFLPSARSSMVCEDEIDTILDRAYEYITVLFKFLLTTQEFQFNHVLFMEFKRQLKQRIGFALILKTNWQELAREMPDLMKKMQELEKLKASLSASLRTVRAMMARTGAA
eukprot:368700-Amphidinium_carterae.1